jgi:hypothetical protein
VWWLYEFHPGSYLTKFGFSPSQVNVFCCSSYCQHQEQKDSGQEAQLSVADGKKVEVDIISTSRGGGKYV